MFDIFQKYITEKASLTDQEIEKLRTFSIHRKLHKRQFILREGEVCRHNCFVAKGCLRSYRIGEDGTEYIMRFAVENWWISDRESLNEGTPSKSNIDALEDSEVFLWTKEDFDHLMKEIPALSIFSERLLAKSFNSIQNRMFAQISQSAEEKYNSFIQSYPDLFKRVPLHMIASYLGVTRETLSRIRIKHAHK
jgi:CRP-like cAMP-binding protein